MWTRCSSCQKSHPSVKAELQVFSEGLQGVRGGGQANTQEPRGPYQGAHSGQSPLLWVLRIPVTYMVWCLVCCYDDKKG